MKDFILVAVVVAILYFLSRNRAKVIAALQKANPVQSPVSVSPVQPTGSVNLNTPTDGNTTNVVISTDDGNSYVISDSVPLSGGSIQLN
jgi:hypothetical protein